MREYVLLTDNEIAEMNSRARAIALGGMATGVLVTFLYLCWNLFFALAFNDANMVIIEKECRAGVLWQEFDWCQEMRQQDEGTESF